jgi:hypothetical protein
LANVLPRIPAVLVQLIRPVTSAQSTKVDSRTAKDGSHSESQRDANTQERELEAEEKVSDLKISPKPVLWGNLLIGLVQQVKWLPKKSADLYARVRGRQKFKMRKGVIIDHSA